jgi:hypothetical protein
LLIIILLYLKTKYDNQTLEDEEMNEEIIKEKQYDYEPDTVADALNWLNKQSELGGEIIEEKEEENV